jgi:hypothetical protein
MHLYTYVYMYKKVLIYIIFIKKTLQETNLAIFKLVILIDQKEVLSYKGPKNYSKIEN